MKRLALILLLLVIFLGAGYYYWKHKSHPAAPHMGGGLPVVTYKVVPKLLIVNFQAVGTLEANEVAVLKAEIPGLIKTVDFVEGQFVPKNTVLLQIDPSTYQAELEVAQAAYDIARLTYDRNNQLRLSGATSAQAKDEAKATMNQRLGAKNAAQIRLERTKIRAPFDGVMGLRNLSVGDFLDTGTLITQIVDLKSIKLEFTVVEKYFSGLKLDQKIQLSVDAWPGQTFEGKVYAIAPGLDPQTRQVSVKAILDNSNGQLRPGMFAKIRIQLSEKPQALMIPEQAIIPQGDTFSVMRVINGKVAIKPVKIGVRQDSFVEVLEGLSANDEIITAGQMKVQEGMPVQAIPDATKIPAKG